MSTLVGLYYRDGREAAPDALAAMLDGVAHRVADVTGAWSAGSVGLGQRVLRTTRESLNETLPLWDSRASLTLAADARLDNREELFNELCFAGRPAEDVGDGELLLAAYERWGEDCPAKLLGDFAFAIWDGRRRRLFCARDHFGVRQLYYHCAPRLFACATEIKALFRLAEVPRRLNEARIADYLLSLFEDKSATLYADVHALPPAHSLTVDRDGLRLREYWKLDPEREVKYGSDGEYAEAYLEIFREAVRCRMRSAGSVGSALSGGLDSSAITCVARDIAAAEGRGPLHTFSAIYDGVSECDERLYMDAVISRGGFTPHFVRPAARGPLTDWEKGLADFDEPPWNPQMALHWAVYAAARRERVCVLLDGFGGDFVVSYGVGRIADLARRGRWLAALGETSAIARRGGSPFTRVLWRHAMLPLLPASLRRLRNRLRGGEELAAFRPVPLREEFVRRIGLRERIRSSDAGPGRRVPSARRRHYESISSGTYPFSLGVVDRITAMFGVERRQPFTDRRLIEFCLALPSEQKLRDGWARYVARRALADVLPAEVQWRRGKSDYSTNFHRGLTTRDRGVLAELILDSPGRLVEYVDVARLRRLHRSYIARPSNAEGAVLWGAAMLARWLGRSGFARKSPGRAI
jgi:asparagine synthase (glutamine-hydrolysing)